MNIKSIFAGLIVLSLVTVNIVSAGNIGNAVTNNHTTSSEPVVIVNATITSPLGGEKFMNNIVNVSYISNGTDLKYKIEHPGDETTPPAPILDLPPSPIPINTTVDGDYIITILNSTGQEVLDDVIFKIDHIAPGDVTFTSSSSTYNSITWSWTNPTDYDLTNIHVEVKKTSDNSIVVPDTTIGIVNSYIATGLQPETGYTITVRTEDDAGIQDGQGIPVHLV